jgi:hypothetical protein
VAVLLSLGRAVLLTLLLAGVVFLTLLPGGTGLRYPPSGVAVSLLPGRPRIEAVLPSWFRAVPAFPSAAVFPSQSQAGAVLRSLLLGGAVLLSLFLGGAMLLKLDPARVTPRSLFLAGGACPSRFPAGSAQRSLGPRSVVRRSLAAGGHDGRVGAGPDGSAGLR